MEVKGVKEEMNKFLGHGIWLIEWEAFYHVECGGISDDSDMEGKDDESG